MQNIDIRKKLIANKIFVATYWPNVFSWTVADSVEHGFADYLIPLPIDQRYGEDDIERILKIINNKMSIKFREFENRDIVLFITVKMTKIFLG